MQTRNIQIWKLDKLAIVAFVSLLFPLAVSAELWKFQPTVTLEERYEDNLRLTTSPHESVTATALRGNVAFSRLTETGGITGRLRADASHYTGDDQIKSNTNNVLFTINAKNKTELSETGVDFSYKRDNTIRNIDINAAQDPEDNIDNDLDAGLVEVDIKRETIKLRPKMSYKLNERTALNVSYQLSDVKYKNNVGSALFDYDRHVVRVGVGRNLTERDLVSFGIAAGRYRAPDNNDNEVESYELVVGYKRALSEKTIGEIILGANESKQSSLLSSSDDNGFIVRGKLEHSTEQTRYLLEGSHDLQPSGAGSLREINQVDFKLRHGFSTRLKGIVNIRAIQRNTIENDSEERQHYLSIEPGLRWKLTRWWEVGTGIRYRKSKHSSNADSADSNAVYMSIGYSKPYTSD